MKVALECLYCGHRWTLIVYSKAYAANEKCVKCKDKNLKVKDLSSVDYYKGSPPFKDDPDEYLYNINHSDKKNS